MENLNAVLLVLGWITWIMMGILGIVLSIAHKLHFRYRDVEPNWQSITSHALSVVFLGIAATASFLAGGDWVAAGWVFTVVTVLDFSMVCYSAGKIAKE